MGPRSLLFVLALGLSTPNVAATREITTVLLTPAVEAILDRIWSGSRRACEPRAAEEARLRDLVTGETAPHRQIDLLDRWRSSYSDSPSCEVLRTWLSTLAHVRTGDAKGAAKMGELLVERLPDGLERRFFLVWLAPGTASPSKAKLARVDEASSALLSELGSKRFRPIRVDGLTGSAIRDAVELVARFGAGLTAFERRDWGTAQFQLRLARRIMPESAFLAYKLGNALLSIGDTSLNGEALRELAYAAEREGYGALRDEDRLSVRSYLEQAWGTYSGGRTYEALLEAIRNEQAIDYQPREELGHGILRALLFPQPYWQILIPDDESPGRTAFHFIWNILRDERTADRHWDMLRGKPSPNLELEVIGPETGGPSQTIRLGVGNVTLVLLHLAEPMEEAPTPGERVRFGGVFDGFQREPFLLTLRDGRIE